MTRLAYDELGLAIQILRPGPVHKMAVGAASAQSGAVGAATTAVRLVATTAVHYAVGADPTADANGSYLPADTVEYLQVRPGEKVAVIQASAAGDAWITEAG